MRSSKRCVGAARTVLLAVALATVDAAAAGASQFGMEGTDAVVRFDPGEQIQLYNSLNGPSPPFRIETNAATGTVTATNDVEPFFGGAVPTSTNPWGLAAPRAGAGCAPGTGRTVVCPLAGVQRIASSSAPPPASEVPWSGRSGSWPQPCRSSCRAGR